jgi:DNA-binding protein H-NS
MSKLSIASQLSNIQKQREILARKEATLRAEYQGKILNQIVKMAKDSGLTLAEITAAIDDSKNKSTIASKNSSKPILKSKTHSTKGVKLAAKYINPSNPTQTWTGRGVAPSWVAELKKSGQLESALIQIRDAVLVLPNEIVS